MDHLGYNLNISNGIASVKNENGRLLFEAKLIGKDLYQVEFFVNTHRNNEEMTANLIKDDFDVNLWHKRYGHLNKPYLEKLKNENLVEGMDNPKNFEDCCEACLKGKGCRLPFSSSRPKAKELLERVHSDVCGPLTPVSNLGNRYFITFIDDFSHFAVVYPMKNKSEAFAKFREFVAGAESKIGKKVREIRCDQGGEYRGVDFVNFCKMNGIIIDYTPRYTPQKNGVAERFNRTLVEKMVTMLYDSKLPNTLWDQAIETATYLINRSPTTALEGMIPAEAWYKEKQNVSHL